MLQKFTRLFSREKLVRKSLAPLLVGLEQIFSRFKKNRLIVLYAHLYPDHNSKFDQINIENNLKYLKEHCQVLPLPEALDLISAEQKLPERAIAIIVDDATRSFFQFGRKLLSDAGLPYTLAVIPGLIRSQTNEHLLARLMRIAGHSYWLSNQEMLERAYAWFGSPDKHEPVTFATIFSRASKLSEPQLLLLLDHIRALDHDFMTWEELKEIKAQDPVDFASHTMSHPQLRYAAGEWLDWELNRSKQLIEKNLGVTVNSLVVPYGHQSHFTPDLHLALERSGYQYNFFTEKGSIASDTFPFQLPRLPLEDEYWRLRIHSCPSVCSVIYPGLRTEINQKLSNQKYLSL